LFETADGAFGTPIPPVTEARSGRECSISFWRIFNALIPGAEVNRGRLFVPKGGIKLKVLVPLAVAKAEPLIVGAGVATAGAVGTPLSVEAFWPRLTPRLWDTSAPELGVGEGVLI
jgi:hypothetical protein